MTDKYKGIVEIEILGEKRGFKFGTASMLQLCQVLKCSLVDVVKRLDDKSDLEVQLNFFYTGACQYVRLKKADDKDYVVAEPTFEQVANWVDSILPSQKEEITNAAFSQYADPNTEAPKTAGQS